MPTEVKPYRENRVLYYRLASPLDFAELQQAVDLTYELFLAKAVMPIHYIVDLSSIHEVYRQHFSDSVRLLRKRHPMSGHSVLIVRSAFMERMVAVMINLADHIPMHVVRSEQEAWRIIDALLAQETTAI